MSYLFLKKSITQLIANATNSDQNNSHSGLKRTLGPIDITMLGVGAIIGAGIFSLTGQAAANYSGPAIIISFIIGGTLCALCGLCYAEMAAMIPISGSAYTYAYTTLGEFMAWIVGWTLILEYAFGASVVANSWSSYLLNLLQTINVKIPDHILYYTAGPWEHLTLSSGQIVNGTWNVPASFIALAIMILLYRGMSKSATFNTIIVITKMTIVALFIILGFGVISWSKLNVNPNAHFLGKLVPAKEITINALGQQISRYGWLNGGVLSGAGMVFFAYVGLDAVSTVAQEAKNPKRDLPIGILGSLLICTIAYVLVGLVLTGVVHYKQLGISHPIALGIEEIVKLRHWSSSSQFLCNLVIQLGALAGLTSVVLVFTMGQTRIFYAISKDGLLPWFNKLHSRYQTPHVATVFTGIFIALCGGLIPITVTANLVSLGTLLVFLVVCISVIILRFVDNKAERAFRVPMAWLVCPSGVIACMYVMQSITLLVWIYLIFWLLIGVGIYFIYGRRHSVQQLQYGYCFGPKIIDCIGFLLITIGLISIVWSCYNLSLSSTGHSLKLIYNHHINSLMIILSSTIGLILGFRIINKNRMLT